MRRSRRASPIRPLAVTTLTVAVCLAASGCTDDDRSASTQTTPGEVTQPVETTPAPPETAPEAPAPPPPTPAPQLPPPAEVPFSWSSAGALVWHETDVEPTALGQTLRAAGFGWVAVYLHDGLVEDPVEADWVYRFRLASGLPVGGWGVLRTEPEQEAVLAHQLLGRYSLDFYIANPEVEYEFSGETIPSPERSGRSQRFVSSFRAQEPSLPAGVSSYCRPDRHDIDWTSWRQAGFVFLPQSYVNDLGEEVAPASCVEGAAAFFPRSAVHPTVGMHQGVLGSLDAGAYVELLARAGTVGFSVYLAETRMDDLAWQTFGAAISERGLAHGA